MPSRYDVAYFGAGPALLPTPVIEAAAQALTNYKNAGIGLAEISHHSPTVNQILADTKADPATLLDIPDTHEILFTQRGGTGQFAQWCRILWQSGCSGGGRDGGPTQRERKQEVWMKKSGW
jgi:phosphoserine aminotransferase